MLRTLIFAMLLFTCRVVSGQAVVISEDLRERDKTPEFGMNRKHYRHFFAGFGFAAGNPENPGAEIQYGRSWTFDYGLRYKRRFNDTFSAGYELLFKRASYFPRQESGKLVPGPELHDREKIVFSSLGAGLYQRINYGKRGDYIGRFIDLGVYGDWHFNVRHVSFDQAGRERVRVRRTGMDYPESLGYGILFRKGFNNMVFKAAYRLSDLFREDAGLPEFTRLTVGLELGLHPF
jgi:hypothetical protein